MKINKIFCLSIIISIFAGFCIFDINQKSNQLITNVVTPTVIKTNKDTICIPDIETFTGQLNVSQTFFEKKYNIGHIDAIKLGYLTDKFASDLLQDKTGKIKYTGKSSPDCQYADIIVNNHSYKEQLQNSGFDLTGDFSEKLNQAHKLNLVILNHKSNIYHQPDCEYAKIARDIKLLPKSNLPKDAKPCQYCHIKKQKSIKTYPLLISNGDIKLFLTDFTKNLKPNNQCSSLICQELLSSINSTKESIDIALYGWNEIPKIFDALTKAKNRGVKIRIVYDISKNSYYNDTEKLLKIADVKSGDTNDIFMHNKFMIFDNKKVITGSMNFAPTGLAGFNSNAIVSINSEELAEIYKYEFEQMINGKFHNNKTQTKSKTIKLNNTNVTPLFSPKDKIITNNIIPLINSAKHYIFIPAFIITHEEFSNALILAHKRNVNVKIIVDASNSKNYRSKIQALRQAGIPVKIENYAGKMHSKSIIIDDKYIITGSMNFSKSGELRNDENVLIIENERFSRYYREFFEYIWLKIPDKYLKQYVNAEGKESIGSCSDGVDNDFDGKIDLQDEACQ